MALVLVGCSSDIKVKFNRDGGSAVSEIIVPESGIVEEPTAPTKSGYMFLGWYLKDQKFDFSTPVTSTITLKAKWAEAVTVYLQVLGETQEILVPKNQTFVLPTPEREGYSFVGWFKDQQTSEVFLFTETITSNITLYAKWLETDTRTFTRGEWIALLLTQVNAEVSENTNQTNYYGDTEGTEYSAEIEAAKAYGIIPADEDEQDVPLFNPDELATREFAAITAVLAMGFVGDDRVLECADKTELTYPELDLIAIKEGFVVLEDNHFYPSRALSGTEKDQIFDVINIINESTVITEEIEEVSYSSNVVSEELKSIKNYTVSYNDAGNYVVTVLEDDATKEIKEKRNQKSYIVINVFLLIALIKNKRWKDLKWQICFGVIQIIAYIPWIIALFSQMENKHVLC